MQRQIPKLVLKFALAYALALAAIVTLGYNLAKFDIDISRFGNLIGLLGFFGALQFATTPIRPIFAEYSVLPLRMAMSISQWKIAIAVALAAVAIDYLCYAAASHWMTGSYEPINPLRLPVMGLVYGGFAALFVANRRKSLRRY